MDYALRYHVGAACFTPEACFGSKGIARVLICAALVWEFYIIDKEGEGVAVHEGWLTAKAVDEIVESVFGLNHLYKRSHRFTTLRSLVKRGLVEKRLVDGYVRRVEYRSTERGRRCLGCMARQHEQLRHPAYREIFFR